MSRADTLLDRAVAGETPSPGEAMTLADFARHSPR